MSQSLAKLWVHLIFSTKGRHPWLRDPVRESLHRSVATVFQNLGCPAIIMNSVTDHIHILFELGRTMSISEVVKEIKKSSSRWLKTQGAEFAVFEWQAGYGAFTVSESNQAAVQKHIANQAEHHRTLSFQEEYLAFLRKHRVAFEEKYVWD